MRIDNSNTPVLFGQLDSGDTFKFPVRRHSLEFFLKTNGSAKEMKPTAVNLATGELLYFNDEQEVIPVNCVLKVMATDSEQ